MKRNKNNVAYILHIRDAINHISSYTSSHNFGDFNDNEWDQAAVLRYLEIIGEAAGKLELSFRNKHSEIPWREVSDLRNVIIHDYMNVDLPLIWEIITKDIPKLKKQIHKIVSSSEDIHHRK